MALVSPLLVSISNEPTHVIACGLVGLAHAMHVLGSADCLLVLLPNQPSHISYAIAFFRHGPRDGQGELRPLPSTKRWARAPPTTPSRSINLAPTGNRFLVEGPQNCRIWAVLRNYRVPRPQCGAPAAGPSPPGHRWWNETQLPPFRPSSNSSNTSMLGQIPPPSHLWCALRR